MKYPTMLTLKSSPAINQAAEEMARQTGRGRSRFVRDLIKTVAGDQAIRETITERMKKDLFNDPQKK